MIKNSIISFFALMLGCFSFAQNAWEVPKAEKEKISHFTFDDDFINEGELIYENSCMSCHGNPTQTNFTIMVPSPGDVASESYQKQSDGELYYKILKGRGLMPQFEDVLSSEEIWNLVAYIRKFNDKYVQPIPDLGGIEIPKFIVRLAFDDNVDKLVVKVFSEEEKKPVEKASVSTFIKGMFGNFLLGKETTNSYGIAYFDIDTRMPGDTVGNLNVIAKVSKGYGSTKIEQKISMVDPVVHRSAIEGRHLWSVAKKAPIWMIITFNLIGIGIWGAIIYILFGLRKIKKLR